MMKSFIQAKAEEKKLPKYEEVEEEEEDVDEKSIRLQRGHASSSEYVTIKRRGFLYTDKESSGFFLCCGAVIVYLIQKRKAYDVELKNRRLTVRKGGLPSIFINFNTMRVNL